MQRHVYLRSKVSTYKNQQVYDSTSCNRKGLQSNYCLHFLQKVVRTQNVTMNTSKWRCQGLDYKVIIVHRPKDGWIYIYIYIHNLFFVFFFKHTFFWQKIVKPCCFKPCCLKLQLTLLGNLVHQQLQTIHSNVNMKLSTELGLFH